MKKTLLVLILLPFMGFGQNLLDIRTDKSENGQKPNIEAEVIDGRTSNQPSFFTPHKLELRSVDDAKTIKYRVKYNADLGLPIYLEVYKKKKDGGFGINEVDEEYSLNTVLEDLPGLFGWSEKSKLDEVSRNTDELGITHIRYQQRINQIRVKGGQWILHLKDGEVQSGNGRIYPSVTIKTDENIGAVSAQRKAYAHVIEEHHHYVKPNLGIIDRSAVVKEYIDFETGQGLNPRHVYTVKIRPTDMEVFKVWVDAFNGTVLKTIDELCEIDGPKTANATDLNGQSRVINSYQRGSTYYMVNATKSMWTNSQPSSFPDNPIGAIWTIDAGNTAAQSITQVSSNNNTWSEKSSVSAHANAGIAFDYFKNTHNRNSINGTGGSIISVVNVSDDDGSSLANAYWNGQAMFYGNGGSTFTPLAGALDVAGHELSHGVVSNTANLEYEDQSGAINESMADVFGAMMDRDDWKIGEDIVRPGKFAGGALRNLQNPHNGGTSLSNRGYQPEKMSEYYTGSQDNYGVHINSGIVNRAYYLTATSITKTKAEKIWYRALTQYLTSKSRFLDLRYACTDAANDLYGSTEVAAVKNAFDVVQIYDPNAGSGGGSGTGGGSDIPTNPGSENIVSVDLNTSDPNTMYKSSTAPGNYIALTQNTPKRKCSITDDGEFLFYVTNSSILRRILLTSPYTELQLSNDLWDNVAISKDGDRLAAVSTAQDGKIWIYDFVTATWKTFTLYNPTYTEGVDAGNVNYADAIEFDNTGQFILYDAQNEITNSGGTNLQWWDVGILRVWDNESDEFGDGKVEKIFSQLPTGVSIGNASYAKNSPYIIAFDYIAGSNVQVSAMNTLTGATATIFTQDKLGFPSYSNKDDKLIFDANNTSGDPVVALTELAADKINVKAGTVASVHIPDAKWGVWYANGTRNLLSDKKELLTFSFPGLAGSPEGTISGNTITVDVPGGTDISSLTPTFTNSPDAKVTVQAAEQVSGVTLNNYTSNVVYRVKAQDESSRDYTVTVNVLTTGIFELGNSISIYPNPTNGSLRINSKVQIDKITCYSVNGQELEVLIQDKTVDLSNLVNGVYFLQIDTPQGQLIKRIHKL
ncbi:MAG: metalloprotease [Bacteroidetes bacterium]|nr:MAG: metalloprotease [Bacteroidota bacterium]